MGALELLPVGVPSAVLLLLHVIVVFESEWMCPFASWDCSACQHLVHGSSSAVIWWACFPEVRSLLMLNTPMGKLAPYLQLSAASLA